MSFQKPHGTPHVGKQRNDPQKNFDLRLQGIRGLAALIVAFHHSLDIIPVPSFSAKIIRGLEGIFSAQAAVLTFFILSGYVLGLSLGKSDSVNFGTYGRFMVRRIFRIMVPLVATLLFASALVPGTLWLITGSTFVPAHNWGTPLMEFAYNQPFGFCTLLRNICLWDHDLNPVTWTITIEMIGSSLIPIFFLLNKHRCTRAPLLIALLALALLSPATETNFSHYLYTFDLGLLIPFVGASFFSSLERYRLLEISLVLALILCVTNAHFGHNFYILSPSLAFLLAFVVFRDHPWLRLLDSQAVEWLGKISYSFYLLHFPILWLMTWFLLREMPSFGKEFPVSTIGLLFTGSTFLAALIGTISYRWVEVPAISWGKSFVR